MSDYYNGFSDDFSDHTKDSLLKENGELRKEIVRLQKELRVLKMSIKSVTPKIGDKPKTKKTKDESY